MLRLAAPAKVNLFLRLLGRRADGYHELATCLHALDLHDVVEAEPTSSGVALTMISETDRGLPVTAGDDNLVCRAARAFFAASGRDGGVSLTVTKRVPAGAGLGGGSSDAATTLRLLNAMHDGALDDAALHRVARGLGADVPFFLAGGTQIGTGVGDQLAAVENPPFFHFLLVLPPFGTSTAAVYQKCVVSSQRRDNALTMGRNVFSRRELDAPERFVNDLEEPAFALHPPLAELRERIACRGFPAVRMSGSGSTLFLAFGSQGEAEHARSALEDISDMGVSLLRTETDRGHASAEPVEVGGPGPRESTDPGASEGARRVTDGAERDNWGGEP